MDKILKVQGTANTFLKSEIEKNSEYSLDGKVVFLTTLAEFMIHEGEVFTVYDLHHKMDLGKVRFLETYLPFNQVLNILLEGHRAIGLYELVDTDKSIIHKMKEYHRFDLVEDRFFLYKGNFKLLYDKYYARERKSDHPQK
jgi:hypothetical protein